MSVRLYQLDTEQALQDALARMNESGQQPDIAGVDADYSAFLAALHEVGGDETELIYLGTDAEGRPYALEPCDECAAETRDWSPQFPVLVLLPSVAVGPTGDPR